MRHAINRFAATPRPDTSQARRGLRHLRVCPRPGHRGEAVLLAGTLSLPCVIGPAGMTARKREGDGATPRGSFRLVGCFYRADRGPRPSTLLSLRVTRQDDGWCDDPADRRYNRPVRLPFASSHESMWRPDRLYDLGIVVDYNQTRPRKHLGSAIFIHVMAPQATPTAGCVALRPGDLRRLLPRLARGCRIRIG